MVATNSFAPDAQIAWPGDFETLPRARRGDGEGEAKAPAAGAISFSAIISALTFAIDLTEGAVPGHALRSCILGMRLAYALDVPQMSLPSLYYALLLKDVGCSSNASRLCEVFGGNDVELKNGVKLMPRKQTLRSLSLLWKQVLPDGGPLRRVTRILKIALNQQENTADMITLRCERGASIVRKLGLSPASAEAVYALDEHWDGSGNPSQLTGDSIPLFARIMAVSQHLDLFASEHGCDVAIQELIERSGRWFDPTVVEVADSLHHQGALWNGCLPSGVQDEVRALALAFEPDLPAAVAPEAIDLICEAFAEVVDAKSPFTYRHSLGVAEVAAALAQAMELLPEQVQTVRRAALLHDLGKLAVPNTILDKRGNLTPEEWLRVVEHPKLTREILNRIEPFGELAEIAGAHHEKLDGTGYPDHLRGTEIGLLSRIVAVADCYQAITEQRPYRQSVSHSEAVKMLANLAPEKLDADCVAALRKMRRPKSQPAAPAGQCSPAAAS